MSRNQVKLANVVLSKLIYNLLTKERINFEDVKVEEASPRLVNVFLVSFQGFEQVLGSTHQCPSHMAMLEVLKMTSRVYSHVHTHVYNMPMYLPIFSTAKF